MRHQGTITHWLDEKGYGFITRKDNGDRVFFHISDCPRGAIRPQTGWVVSFELTAAQNGKFAAHHVHSEKFLPKAPGKPATARATRPAYTSKRRRRGQLLNGLLLLLAVSAAGYGVKEYYRARQLLTLTHGTPPAIAAPASSLRAEHVPPGGTQFQCDQRIYCSQMTSRSEALYFLAHCPGAKMDGDGDGEPCEQQFGH
ncbi:cold shock domain-containing protein [Vogesella sp. DC21W]|uniref:Cold shock domain-containing protein n=1 Tax=Vogesella aquatica TaxID=2984206 RepID=A0ABT5J1L1_9NEIS|nr:cold shock domain-containing protein [Vogesella aquatica]MDC7718371.1 cold shock domain-containing protein [Vogesella aquatica]